jgi:hypothetical protein
MKLLIKKLLREHLLSEERYDINNLSNKTILVIKGNQLTLYNTSFLNSENPDDGVLGYIAIDHNDNHFYVEQSVAKKGFGPLMYELAMQYVYDSPLMPDFEGNTNKKALRMWDYFYNGNNPDVKVIELKDGQTGYRDFIGYNGVDKSLLYLFNSRFYLKPNELYYLESNTEDFFDENDKSIGHQITRMGQHFFNQMYLR